MGRFNDFYKELKILDDELTEKAQKIGNIEISTVMRAGKKVITHTSTDPNKKVIKVDGKHKSVPRPFRERSDKKKSVKVGAIHARGKEAVSMLKRKKSNLIGKTVLKEKKEKKNEF